MDMLERGSDCPCTWNPLRPLHDNRIISVLTIEMGVHRIQEHSIARQLGQVRIPGRWGLPGTDGVSVNKFRMHYPLSVPTRWRKPHQEKHHEQAQPYYC
jgi:hypothetical protein